MADIIIKSGYISNIAHVVNLIRYMADKAEAQTINSDGSIKKEDIGKFINRVAQRTKTDMLITEDGTEKELDAAIYLNYIATRPSVELAENHKHGLFTLQGDADIDTEIARIVKHKDSIRWSQIISLSREDAERTGYDNRAAWQALIQSKASAIAKIYNISIENLVVNAAYHNKDHHPHVHIMFYSTKRREGYVPDMTKASEKLKSLFFNEIFHEDVERLKGWKNELRNDMSRTLESAFKRICSKNYSPPVKLPGMLLELSEQLRDVPGRKVYGYLPPELKRQVSEILRYMVDNDIQLHTIFEEYLSTHRDFVARYIDDPEKIEKRMSAFVSSFFEPKKGGQTTLHNLIIRHALLAEQNPTPRPGRTVQKEMGNAQPKNTELESALTADSEITVQKEMDTSWSESSEDSPRSEIDSGRTVQKKMGTGRPQDVQSQAFKLYKLGRRYLDGTEVPFDSAAGVMYLQQSAALGNHYAQYSVGRLLLNGNFVAQNTNEAVRYFTLSAEQGNQYAQCVLGKLYMEGKDVPKNKPLATVYLQQSAAQGNGYAQYLLTHKSNTALQACMLLMRSAAWHLRKEEAQSRAQYGTPHSKFHEAQTRQRFTTKKPTPQHDISTGIHY